MCCFLSLFLLRLTQHWLLFPNLQVSLVLLHITKERCAYGGEPRQTIAQSPTSDGAAVSWTAAERPVQSRLHIFPAQLRVHWNPSNLKSPVVKVFPVWKLASAAVNLPQQEVRAFSLGLENAVSKIGKWCWSGIAGKQNVQSQIQNH